MEHSSLTKLLNRVIQYLVDVEAPASFRFPLRVIVSILVLLETNHRLWIWILGRLELIIPLLSLTFMLVHSLSNSVNIPLVAQIGLPIIFAFCPLYWAIKENKELHTRLMPNLLLHSVITFIFYLVGLYTAFYLLTIILPTPENINIRTSLFERLLPLTPSLLVFAIYFGCIIPFIVLKFCGMIDKANLQNRFPRLIA